MPELCKLERAHTEVGFQTLALNLTAVWGREPRRRQPDRSAAPQRDQVFDRAFAECLGAERHRPLIVLQGPDDELGLPRRPAIDQRNDRQTLREVSGGGADALGVGGL